MNLTTPKTKQFCETSSIFEVDNIKNEAILRDFIQKWKVENKSDGLVPMRLAIFPFHLFKVLRLPRKSEARSYEVLRLSRKITLANLKISCSKMQTLSGNLCADLLTFRLPREMHLYGSSSNVFTFRSLDKVHNPLRLPCETTSDRPKVLRTRQFSALLTPKCASRHNGVHFFNISMLRERCVLYILAWKRASRHNGMHFVIISTSKSGLRPLVFLHF